MAAYPPLAIVTGQMQRLADGDVLSGLGDGSVAGQSVRTQQAAPTILLFGNISTASTDTTEYLDPGGSGRAATTNEGKMQVTSAGKIAKLRVRARTGPASDNIVVTARKNGANQSLTATLAAAGTSASDLSNNFTVVAGDDISVEINPGASISAGAADLYVSMEYTIA